MNIQKVNIQEKLDSFTDHWSPKIIGALNGQEVKLAKLHGEFVWHHHEHEDELFMVISGQLHLEFRDHTQVLNPGEFCIVPRGVEHRPVAPIETSVLLFEPAGTVNTGNVTNEKTVKNLDVL